MLIVNQGKGEFARSALSVAGVTVWFACFCLVLAGLVAWELVSDHGRQLDSARFRTTSTSMLIEEWMADYFRTTDQTLQTLVGNIDPDELRLPHSDETAGRQLTQRLFEARTVVPSVDEVGLFNAAGLMTHTTADPVTLGQDVSQRAFFVALRDQPALSSVVSPVFWSPVVHAFKLVQARPVRDAAGRFRGAAGVRIDIDFFSGWLDRVRQAEVEVIAIVDTASTLIAVRPQASEAWGAHAAGARIDDPALAAFLGTDSPRGHYRARSAVDGVDRIFSVARVPGIPIAVIVGEPVDKVLMPWRRKLWTFGAGLAFIYGFGFAGLRAYLQLRSRGLVLRDSREALARSNQALATEIEERRTSEARFRALFENSLDGVGLHEIVCDGAGVPCDYRFLMINAAFERHSGLSAEQVLGKRVTEVNPAIRDSGLIEIYARVALSGESTTFEFAVPALSRHFSIAAFQVGQGRFATVFEDITERKNAELQLRIAATAFESQEGMLVTDAQSVILRVNRAFSRMTGYSAEDVVGKTPKLLRSGRHEAGFYAEMWRMIARDGEWKGELWNRRRSGEVYPQWLTITAVRAGTGEITHYVGTLTDISARKAAEEEVRNLAFYDPLTRLPNRRLLMDRLKRVIASSARHGYWSALLFMDLDDFKLLNDSLGHDKGDLLLRRVAVSLQACVRESDTIGRLGGDEFVIIFENICDRAGDPVAAVEALGRKLLAAVGATHDLEGYSHRASASVGVAFIGATPTSLEELMKQADMAMYQAKAVARNTMRFFDPAMQAAVNERATLEVEMRGGIERGEFVVYYQSQVDVSNRVVGMEALARWHHPRRGLVAPATFVDVAERTGLIVPLGRFVLRAACACLAQWAAVADRAHLTVSVNISPRQFHEDGFVECVREAMGDFGVGPGRLILEITESMLLENMDEVVATMVELKASGVGFSLDDFGTGYSSLAYLKRLPLDEIKIDRSFVRDVLTDGNDAAIARTIIALAQSLELAVVAEGVETGAQRDWLARHGCQTFQGYYFGRPAPIASPAATELAGAA